jgi:prephenate dehydratase
LVPAVTVHAGVVAVQSGECDRALVPIENALEGAVNATLAALAFDAPSVAVVGEEVLGIEHCLVARGPIGLDEITTVLSHPQANAQCQGFLRREVPQARVLPAASTAEAIRLVAEGLEAPGAAAIGTRLAAELYGATVIREGIEDDPANVTRFVWLAAADADMTPLDAAIEGPWKTSVVFGGDGDGQPGWLVRCLSEFAFRGVNLNKIESRPSRHRMGHYLFHVDLDGGTGEQPVRDAIEALSGHCSELRVLGSYPAA